jgi:hypothetical protein
MFNIQHHFWLLVMCFDPKSSFCNCDILFVHPTKIEATSHGLIPLELQTHN